MQPISSLQNPTIKLVRSLSDKKGRRESGLFMAEGRAMLERAMDQGWVPEHVIATKPPHLWDEVRPLVVTDKLMGELSGQNNPHDVLAAFRTKVQPHPAKNGRWLALEEIRDPGNLGTIIRTADAAGATGIILVGQSCDPWGPDCVRATMGSIFGVPLVRLASVDFLDLCRAWPGESVGTHLRATESFRRSYRQPSLLVMGSEGKGLSDEASAACSALVRIPMREGAESLNVAIATGLILYEALKR